ncbi:MAG: ABC transporter ATP-binding protein [Candidatus Kapaibacterium sp.]|nr:MAG: ABC transporter ATP-binding protein [Candidatus Kapabacteria bacterium]
MLEAINLSKEYNGVAALHSLNLSIQAGEIFCLLGANGAGKTTTINLFMGFTEPTSGEVLVGGINVAEKPHETKKLIAYIPENVMLYPTLTGLENLAYLSGLSGAAYSDAELVQFLQRAGLQEEAMKRRVGEYSKGMRQKVGIAIALAKHAKVLFLDEPTSGLDPLASNEFSRLIRGLANTERVAVLMATHDIFRAEEISDRIGIMNAGHLAIVVNARDISPARLEELYVRTISQKHSQQEAA